MSADPNQMSREELLESLRAAEMQRDMVDDLIRKQQDPIKLMEQKMDKISSVTPAAGDAAPSDTAPDGGTQATQDKSET